MKRAKDMFFPGDGPPVYPETIYADDHPIVRSYPTMFENVDVVEAPGRRSAPVEQATAAPGEKRDTRK